MTEPVSIQTLLLAINSMAKERHDIAASLQAGGLSDEEHDYLSDKALRLTAGLGELADLYEPLRRGHEATFPTIERIFSAYE